MMTTREQAIAPTAREQAIAPTARDQAIFQANAEQRAASNPLASAFVAASAGSGKTKLLTDRLLRLMLAGTPPARILCLTYTKAAAAEMAIRLNRRLGEWVVLPDEQLNRALADLDVPPTPAARETARQLFAQVLDLPGGMRIGTIHAFCQSVLRRFPLEAELSPHFQLADDAEAAARLRESRELILAEPTHRAPIFALAALSNEQDFAALTARFAATGDLLADLPPARLAALQRAALAVDEADEAALMARAVTGFDAPKLLAALDKIAAAGPPKAAGEALWRLTWLTESEPERLATWEDYAGSYFGDKPYSMTTLVGKKLAEANPALCEVIIAEQTRIAAAQEALRAARLAGLNAHVAALARPILQRDAARKTHLASLSYADLITHTLNLLRQPENVAWILYKLDGGIDHLLLDEVQDTAPAQWDITAAIAGEFFAGRGARAVNRTLFAVGDAKQSIFSFQGADLASFEASRANFRAQVQAAGQSWIDGELAVSFRSTAPVLQLVDAVFAEGFATEGVCPPGGLRHGLSRQGQAGAVSLLPLAQAEPAAPLPAWAVPDSYETARSAKWVLAQTIVARIAADLAAGKTLPSRGRRATPGDFLILVRQRDELVTAITRAAKARNIPIAGADRLVLTAQPAVADLLALCDALLLPDDNLAFAHFLASPLGGLSDTSLMELALDRGRKTLAATLFARRAERPEWEQASDLFQALLARVDFVSPHALLAEILHPRGGRARLLQRLGPEAAEPIDELLTEALAFAETSAASLQAFLFALRQSDAAIKSEPEAAGDVVRIMTVHGAKGLQAPIVILPDTVSLPNPRESLFWLPVPQTAETIPIYCPRADLRSAAVQAEIERGRAADMAEYNRLLYVALTRAEDELVIAGAEGGRKIPEACWYNAVKAGFERLGIQPGEDGASHLAAPQTAAPDRAETKSAAMAADLPDWAGRAPDWQARPPAAETTRPEPLAPSRAAEVPAKAAHTASPLAGQAGALRAARAAALAKGRAVHALLQHLPDLAPEARPAAMAKFLADPGLALPAAAQADIAAALTAILQNPALAPLFGPDSRAEAPLAGVIEGAEIGGLVDRLAITEHKILIADYKTDRLPPASPADIPAAYLRQLAAYAAILAEIFPARPIEAILIWTETATPMVIEPARLARHAPFPAQPYMA